MEGHKPQTPPSSSNARFTRTRLSDELLAQSLRTRLAQCPAGVSNSGNTRATTDSASETCVAGDNDRRSTVMTLSSLRVALYARVSSQQRGGS